MGFFRVFCWQNWSSPDVPSIRSHSLTLTFRHVLSTSPSNQTDSNQLENSAVLDVVFLPALVSSDFFVGKTVVVVDVLRATTTIASALSNGCRAVLPQATIEAARAKFAEMEASPKTLGTALIGGERGGQIVDGFHQGNSPVEYSRDVIEDKFLILTTTNGTVAMDHCRSADRVLIGSMVNLTAVARAVQGDAQVVVLCSGTDRLITSEDVLFAGAMMQRISELRQDSATPVGQLTDPAFMALNHWQCVRDAVAAGESEGSPTLADFFRNARGGINLARIGHNRDIEFAANIDTLPVVPVLDLDRWQITL